MKTLILTSTKNEQVVDITEAIETYLQTIQQEEGTCVVFVAHSTCAITTANLDPGTDLDLLDALRGLLPTLSYRHPHDPSHTPDHILSSLLGVSVSIPFAKKRLLLGVWQRIVLIDFNGPKERTVHVSYS